ncbi:MAG: hypothetical protein ACPGWR_02125 [Ardenticatenaceae bacterium]
MKPAGMPTRYISSVERLIIEERMQLAIKQGALQGAREGVLDTLQIRFQNVSLPESVVQTVNSISDRALLKKLHRHAILVESVSKFEQELGEHDERPVIGKEGQKIKMKRAGMPTRYISSVERLAIEKGMELGALRTAREYVLDALQIRFQNVSLPPEHGANGQYH